MRIQMPLLSLGILLITLLSSMATVFVESVWAVFGWTAFSCLLVMAISLWVGHGTGHACERHRMKAE